MSTIISGLFVSGLIFSAGPCLASCGPLLVSYIAGTGKNIYKAFVFYALFSLARIGVYLALSLIVFFAGSIALESLVNRWIALIGGGFILLVGLTMVFDRPVKFKLPAFLERIFLRRDLKNPVIFGIIYGLMPCAPLVAILTYIGLVSKTWQQAVLYMFSFGMGTFLSLLLFVSIMSGYLPGFLKKEAYKRLLRIAGGLIVSAMGIQTIMRGM